MSVITSKSDSYTLQEACALILAQETRLEQHSVISESSPLPVNMAFKHQQVKAPFGNNNHSGHKNSQLVP